MRLFRNYVYYHFIFPKINKRGAGIRAGGLENFSKINKRGERLFGTREYIKIVFMLDLLDSLFLFCFVLFCFVLFCFVLFCFVLFCFVLFSRLQLAVILLLLLAPILKKLIIIIIMVIIMIIMIGT